MARLRKTNSTLEALFFSTAEQKVVRLLLSEPTTAFTPRVLSSKLKGVRGLGGAEGISRILNELQSLGILDFVDNHRAIRVREECSIVETLKIFAALCELEDLKKLLQPVSNKGVLYGSSALGKIGSGDKYELFVVSETPEEVKKISSRHPLARKIHATVWTPEAYSEIESQDATFARKLARGIVVWGSTW